MATKRNQTKTATSVPAPSNDVVAQAAAPAEISTTSTQPGAMDSVSASLQSLSARVMKEAELARIQVEKNLADRGLMQLQQAVEQLQSLARVATATPPAAAVAPDGRVETKPCGCGEKPPTCCVQLYISRVRVAESQGLLEGDLELIFAVRVLDQTGLLPSLSSYMSIAQFGGSWVPVFAPIGKFCVPCNGTLVVPVVAEALETGGLFEGKPERGSAQTQIAMRCSCDVVPVVLQITLGGTLGSVINPKKAKVDVEVSGRLTEGCCC